jgi:hypothetical protein
MPFPFSTQAPRPVDNAVKASVNSLLKQRGGS